MRPPEFTGGNPRAARSRGRCDSCFNEAAGIHRRKLDALSYFIEPIRIGFNEAAGIHRRKQVQPANGGVAQVKGFNEAAGIHRRKLDTVVNVPFTLLHCFNEAAGIHRRKRGAGSTIEQQQRRASMRPPEFTGGNAVTSFVVRLVSDASMRPPEFTGGNDLLIGGRRHAYGRFNEAAGIHRRKRSADRRAPARLRPLQ